MAIGDENVERSHEQHSAVEAIEKNRTGIILTGEVKNGKVIIDKASLDEIARKFPSANVKFVAVNAPFDPQPRSLSVESR